MVSGRQAEYCFSTGAASHTNQYLWPKVEKLLLAHVDAEARSSHPDARSVFDLGCGNGAFVSRLQSIGFSALGVDPSESGVRAAIKHGRDSVRLGSAYDPLVETYGTFPIVVSLEVVEHLYFPRQFASTLFSLVAPGGIAVVSTPYHGYAKNLALALLGRLDAHFTAMWDHGHIKFWSVKTLTALLLEAGFERVDFHFAGRVPLFAKSMIAVARRPLPA